MIEVIATNLLNISYLLQSLNYVTFDVSLLYTDILCTYIQSATFWLDIRNLVNLDWEKCIE